METVEATNVVLANPESTGFWDIVRRFFARLFGATTSPDVVSEISRAEAAPENAEESGRFVLTPCGYAIRVPQASDFNPSVSEMLPTVRKGLNQLPPLPNVAMELLREIQDPNATASSVAEVASSDPALAAALIRTVNAAAMGLSRKITSTAEAVNYLGFATVKAMVLRLRLETVLSPKSAADAADAEDLWIHSLAVSYVAEHLASRVKDVDAGFVATLGLLHDIGKLAILAQMPAEAERLRNAQPEGEAMTSRTREAALLGVDHAGLGANLALQWKLPADLVQAIRWHHRPANAFLDSDPLPLRKAVHLVQIANQIAKYCFPYTDRLEIDVVPDEAYAMLGFEPSLQRLIDTPVRGAITRAILLAESNSRRPLTAPRRFLRPMGGENAKRLVEETNGGASQIAVDDAAIEFIFASDVPEFRYNPDGSGPAARAACGKPQVRFSIPATEKALQNSLVALRNGLAESDLSAESRSIATITMGSLLPNLLVLCNPDEMIEAGYSVSNRRITLAVRAPAQATARRLEKPSAPETSRRLAEADLTSVLNLCWFEKIVVTSDGAGVGFSRN